MGYTKNPKYKKPHRLKNFLTLLEHIINANN